MRMLRVQWGKKNSLCSIWTQDKGKKLDPYLKPYIKINSNWIIYLNVRAKIIKLLVENIGLNLCVLGSDSNFLDMTPKAQATKERNR